MSNVPACPVCTMTEILLRADLCECVTCGHEWARSPDGESVDAADEEWTVADANGNALREGDSVTVVKDLKVKGSSVTLKAGTKIKGIRLAEGDHDVDCKVDGMGVMLKAKFLKKA